MVVLERSEATGLSADPLAAHVVGALPIFAELSTAAIDKLLVSVAIEQVPAKFVLIEEGMPPKWLFVLVRGLLQLGTHFGSNETTLAVLTAPSILNADAMVWESPPLGSIRTLEMSCIGRIEINQARRLYREERTFADAVAVQLVCDYWRALREFKNVRTRSSIQRLIAWILTMFDSAGNPREIRIPYDKAILAARLGVAAASLSRDLARLAPLGVTVRGRMLEIGQVKRLRELAELDGLNVPPVP